MGIIVANDTAIIQTEKIVVDVSQVVLRNPACGIVNPHFPPELSIPAPPLARTKRNPTFKMSAP